MRTTLAFTAFATACSVALSDTVIVGGGRSLPIVKAGRRFNLVSVPFIRPAAAAGRLTSVSSATGMVTAAEEVFGGLDAATEYFILIRTGPARGAWFFLAPADTEDYAASPAQALLDAEGTAGALGALVGGERFSVHPLFRLDELLPTDGSVVPAARLDVLAGQVHLYQGGGCRKYWLSNGELTRAGWTNVPTVTRAGPEVVFLPPGISFFVYHPAPVADVSVPVVGIVPDVPIRKAVRPGFNFLGTEYSLVRDDIGAGAAPKLSALRLDQSGFHGGEEADESDLLLSWDTMTGDYRVPRWLRAVGTGSEWRIAGEPSVRADDELLDPVRGMVLWNGGDGYVWRDGE